MQQLRAFVAGIGARGIARFSGPTPCVASPQLAQQVARASAPAAVPPQPSRRTLHVSAIAYADQGTVAASRTFTQYSIYKGKAAVTFKTIQPTFRQNVSGPYINYTVDREGVVLMEFASVIPSSGPGQQLARNYDWTNKLAFALKPLELAQLTDVDNLPDVSKGIDIYHDPNKGNNDPNAPKVSKRLKLAYNPQGDGYLLTLNQTKDGASANITVPVTRAEFVVLKHLAGYLIPRLLGFDMLFEGAGATPTNLVVGPGNGNGM